MKPIKDLKLRQKTLGKNYDYNTTVYVIRMPKGGYIKDCTRYYKKAHHLRYAMFFDNLLDAKVYCIYLNEYRRKKQPHTVIESYKYIGKMPEPQRKRMMGFTKKRLEEIRQKILSGDLTN